MRPEPFDVKTYILTTLNQWERKEEKKKFLTIFNAIIAMANASFL
jgi:hypothetical protein